MLILDEKIIGTSRYLKIACLSSDTLPDDDDIALGSEAYEVDTAKKYLYNSSTKAWVDQANPSGD